MDPDGVGNDRSKWAEYRLIRLRAHRLVADAISKVDNGRAENNVTGIQNTEAAATVDDEVVARFRKGSTFSEMTVQGRMTKAQEAGNLLEGIGLKKGDMILGLAGGEQAQQAQALTGLTNVVAQMQQQNNAWIAAVATGEPLTAALAALNPAAAAAAPAAAPAAAAAPPAPAAGLFGVPGAPAAAAVAAPPRVNNELQEQQQQHEVLMQQQRQRHGQQMEQQQQHINSRLHLLQQQQEVNRQQVLAQQQQQQRMRALEMQQEEQADMQRRQQRQLETELQQSEINNQLAANLEHGRFENPMRARGQQMMMEHRHEGAALANEERLGRQARSECAEMRAALAAGGGAEEAVHQSMQKAFQEEEECRMQLRRAQFGENEMAAMRTQQERRALEMEHAEFRMAHVEAQMHSEAVRQGQDGREKLQQEADEMRRQLQVAKERAEQDFQSAMGARAAGNMEMNSEMNQYKWRMEELEANMAAELSLQTQKADFQELKTEQMSQRCRCHSLRGTHRKSRFRALLWWLRLRCGRGRTAQ